MRAPLSDARNVTNELNKPTDKYAVLLAWNVNSYPYKKVTIYKCKEGGESCDELGL